MFALLLFMPVMLASSMDKKDKKPNPPKKNFFAFAGTYTTKTQSKGIYAFRYDATSGKLTPAGLAAETPDPSFVAIHPSGKFLYAVNEGGKASFVTSFALDAKTGALTQLNQVPSLGEDPCYIALDQTGKYILIANYTSGTLAVFPILPDGKIGEKTASIRTTESLAQTENGRKVRTRIGSKPARTIVMRSPPIWASTRF